MERMERRWPRLVGGPAEGDPVPPATGPIMISDPEDPSRTHFYDVVRIALGRCTSVTFHVWEGVPYQEQVDLCCRAIVLAAFMEPLPTALEEGS